MSALTCFARAERHWDAGHVASALRWLERSKKYPADPFLNGEIHYFEGELLRQLTRFRSAVKAYLLGHQWFRRAGAESHQNLCLLGAVSCRRVMGQYSSARQTLKLIRTPSAEFLLECALVARGCGRFAEAKKWVNQVLAGGNSISASVRQHAYWIRGGIERFSGNFTASLRDFTQAVRWSPDNETRAFALCGLAGVERVVGRDRDSVRHYTRAHGLLVRAGDRFGEAYGLCGRANAARTYGDPTGAIALYRRSATLYHQMGDKSSQGFAVWGLGGCHRRLGRWSAAQKAYREALTLFRVSRDERGVVMALLGLARLEESLGKGSQALAWIDHAEQAARQSNLRYETRLARYERGRIGNPRRPPVGLLTSLGIPAVALARWKDIP